MHIETPENFNFRNTVYSHGWYQLKPFELDEEGLRLNCVFRSRQNTEPVSASVFERENKLKIDFAGKNLSRETKVDFAEKVKHILCLDENFSGFYALTQNIENFEWIGDLRVGRLMRSPTVFEDLVKTICTTNCSWALTKKMVSNLVEKLGRETPGGKKAFPTAEQMAVADADFYRSEIRTGYRSVYFAELARRVAAGEIDPESWLESDLPTSELKKEIKQIKGIGDYAAENLLKLLGRYDGLALDSALRSGFYEKYKNGNPCPDAEIREFYEKFGKWQGLAIWFDMSRRWLEAK